MAARRHRGETQRHASGAERTPLVPSSRTTGRLGRAVQVYGPDSAEVAEIRQQLSQQRARERAAEIASLDPPLTQADIVELACDMLRRTIDDARAELAEGRAS